MPKDKLTDYSATNASNTDVGGVNIDEGMLPSSVNNAIREVLTHLKNFASGTDGIDVLSLADDDASAAMKIQAPASVTADTTLTLPDGDGDDGQALVTDGSGTLSWASLHSAKNLLINGSFQVAQRRTSSTSGGFQTVDRWKTERSSGVTQSQEDLTSSDTPYDYGFRKALKLTNTANSNLAGDYAQIAQPIEAQNIANSGWDYTSSTSYVTLQFWVKSSLAGTYSALFLSKDGTQKSHSFEFTLVADTWKKVTYTLAGDSSVTIDNNNDSGLEVFIVPHYGTSYTTSGHTDDAWQTYSATDITGDYAQNWKNTSNATFFVTGVQLTVDDVDLPFIHETYGETLAKCQRYYHKAIGTDNYFRFGMGMIGSGNARIQYQFPVEMRARPTVENTGTASNYGVYNFASVKTVTGIGHNTAGSGKLSANVYFSASGITNGDPCAVLAYNNTSAFLAFNAEL